MMMNRDIHRAEQETIPCHQAQELTANGTKAEIELNGQIYTLRITRAGKLILTK